jgi:hypothetical protein
MRSCTCADARRGAALRSCGEGGELLLCSTRARGRRPRCCRGICAACVRYHLGNAGLARAQASDTWQCWVCDAAPLAAAQRRAKLDALQRVAAAEAGGGGAAADADAGAGGAGASSAGKRSAERKRPRAASPPLELD